VTVHLRRVFDAYGPQRSLLGDRYDELVRQGDPRQRITHFTEELSFLSEDDKDW
jgi:hypothetical protein